MESFSFSQNDRTLNNIKHLLTGLMTAKLLLANTSMCCLHTIVIIFVHLYFVIHKKE